jgi:uncharacterized protein Yka (UPF0111/DUF47 family)
MALEEVMMEERMANLSKTAAAAQKAVERGQQKAKVERTTEQIIRDIRNHLDSSLAVTPNDVRALLAEYDKMAVLANDLGTQLSILQTPKELSDFPIVTYVADTEESN